MGFRRGTNVSHWISQTDLSDVDGRRDRFGPDDVRRIAGFGMDHLRLPFDYELLERDDAPKRYDEDGFSWIERGLDWCAQGGLNVVLDMHRAPGASFSAEVNPLYDDEVCQDRYACLWRAIAERFSGRGPEVAFELLNEATAKDPEDWNRVAQIGLDAIRAVDPSRVVFVGSNMWNACDQFPRLRFFDDPQVVYTFHFYHPFCFTHQRASWSRPMGQLYTRHVPYPGRPPGLKELLAAAPPEHRQWAEEFVRVSDREMNRNYLEEELRPALAYRDLHGVTLYCGEFGALPNGDEETRRAWYGDVVGLLEKHGIGWANWDYQGGFGLIGADGSPTVVHEVLARPRQGAGGAERV